MINHQPPFIVGLCCKRWVAERTSLFCAAQSVASLTEWKLSETNYRETIFITLPLQGRGDGPADSLGSCREQGSDTLSHSPALIVQKMWFVPQPHFLGKVVFTVRGVPVAWIALLFSHPGTLSCMCAYVSLYANFFVSECESFHIFCLSFLSTQHFTMWLPFTHQRNIFKKK